MEADAAAKWDGGGIELDGSEGEGEDCKMSLMHGWETRIESSCARVRTISRRTPESNDKKISPTRK